MKSKKINLARISRREQKQITGGAAQFIWCCANCITPWAEYDAIGNSCLEVYNYCNQVGGSISGSCNCSPACML